MTEEMEDVSAFVMWGRIKALLKKISEIFNPKLLRDVTRRGRYGNSDDTPHYYWAVLSGLLSCSRV
ncbi:hypothetical protein J6590_029237 [Homalodisca vitripennis]|nr:hypothetical protein J6590_029237 [Homalodisca vitripennis]